VQHAISIAYLHNRVQVHNRSPSCSLREQSVEELFIGSLQRLHLALGIGGELEADEAMARATKKRIQRRVKERSERGE
jgi:hypothetical protein